MDSTRLSNGEIVDASCGRPAGAGPNGRCKHIVAFTFALEEYYSIRPSCNMVPLSYIYKSGINLARESLNCVQLMISPSSNLSTGR